MKTYISLTLALVLITGTSTNAQVAWSNDFESGSFGSMTQTTNATDGGWKIGNAGQLSSATWTIPAHTQFSATNDDACNCDKSVDWLSTPVMNLSAYSNPYLSFSQFYGELTYQSITENAEIYYSTDGGGTWTLLVDVAPNTGATWEDRSYNLTSQLGGQANAMLQFRYNDGNGWLYGWAVDDVVVLQPASYDAALVAVSPAAGTGPAYAAVNQSISVGGTIKNMGLNTITSVIVHYDAGAGDVTSTVSGLSIPPFGTYTFTHSVPYTVPSVGGHNVNVWVELSGDANGTNDQMTTTIQGVSFMPVHHPVIEEATGTWCGWCPRGTVFMDSLHGEESDAVLIAVHNADPMDIGSYDDGIASVPGFVGYPGISIDRKEVQDPSDIFTYWNQHRSNFGFADVGVWSYFNAGTRQCDVVVSAKFAADVTGDYRFAVVFTEDNVTGTTSQFAQSNYYSYQANDLPLVGAGHDWQAEPNPVPAAAMEYDFVARTILPSFQGQPGSLPGSITAGSYHQYNFSYTIPSGYNEANMRVIGLLLNASTGEIMNANQIHGVSGSVGAPVVDRVDMGMQLAPNPATDQMIVSLNLNKEDMITISVVDVMGRQVRQVEQGTFGAGSHSLSLDLSELPAGTYNLVIAGSTGLSAQTFIKN